MTPQQSAPAYLEASRGVMEPSVPISSVNLSKLVACSTRVGSTENETRRTGEKIASTGITPIVVVRLLRSADR